MTLSFPTRIVLLGMMSKMPVAGNVWLVAHYMEGFRRLGCDVTYVEAHGITPTKLMGSPDDDGSVEAAAFIGRMMDRFGFGDRWAFHALHSDGACYGMSASKLRDLYHTADIIINLHGGTVPTAEHVASGKLLYLETDPVELEIELHEGDAAAREFIAPHRAFATWGLNYGREDCSVPLPAGIDWHISPPPVLMDAWSNDGSGGANFTTIGNWRQPSSVRYNGQVYHWSKHLEFEKFLDLPGRSSQGFELALSRSSMTSADRAKLESHGWAVRDALEFSGDLDAYRDYIIGSRGEFTVAKDQNIRLRSGWFSERSAQYLAAGRPVITQDTGFGNYLPTGAGLFAFTTTEQILEAIELINSDYERHSHAAREIARAWLSYDVVLPRLLLDAWQPDNHEEVRRYLVDRARGAHRHPIPMERP